MKKLLVLILILLLMGAIFFAYQYYTTKKMLSDCKIKESNTEQSSHLLQQSLLQSIVFGSEAELLSLKVEDKEVLLSEVVDGLNTLIFRFSEHTCKPCLERELKNISFLEKQGIPVLVVASYSNHRELKLLLKEFDISSRYILLKENEHLCSFEGTSSDLYIFLLIEGSNIEYLFFPVQNEDNLSKEYFDFIEALFKKHRK